MFVWSPAARLCTQTSLRIGPASTRLCCTTPDGELSFPLRPTQCALLFTESALEEPGQELILGAVSGERRSFERSNCQHAPLAPAA